MIISVVHVTRKCRMLEHKLNWWDNTCIDWIPKQYPLSRPVSFFLSDYRCLEFLHAAENSPVRLSFNIANLGMSGDGNFKWSCAQRKYLYQLHFPSTCPPTVSMEHIPTIASDDNINKVQFKHKLCFSSCKCLPSFWSHRNKDRLMQVHTNTKRSVEWKSMITIVACNED